MPDYVRHDGTGTIIKKWRSADPSVVNGLSNVIQISRAVYELITKYHKVSGNQVIEMTQAEKDALDVAEAQAIIDAENARITNLDDKINTNFSGVTLTKIDIAINNISNLADAKTFLKKLCRYIIKFTVGQ